MARRLAWAAGAVAVAGLALPSTGAGALDPLYPSNDCAESGEVAGGSGGGPVRFFFVRTDTAAPNQTWVCIAVDTAGAHVGGRVVVTTAAPATPSSDDDHTACAADPNNTRVRSGTIGPDNQPYRVDVANRADAVWVCVQATTSAAKRIVVPKPAAAPVAFLPDSTAPAPTTTTTAGPTTTTTTTAPAYFSNDCGTAGMTVLDGFVDGAYVKVRTEQVSSPTPATWLCVAADDGATHRGGRLVLAGATTPAVDDNQAACDANPATRVQHVELGGAHVDVNLTPAQAWVCVAAGGTTKRLVVPIAGLGGPAFLADPTAPYGYVETPAPAGLASSACQGAATGTRTRLVNADVGTTHVWAYAWQEPGGGRSHVCARAQHPAQSPSTAAGVRVDLDAGGSQSVVTSDTSSDFAPCNFNVLSDPTGTPPYAIRTRNPASGSPAWLCLRVDSTYRRVKLDAAGGQGVVAVVPD